MSMSKSDVSKYVINVGSSVPWPQQHCCNLTRTNFSFLHSYYLSSFNYLVISCIVFLFNDHLRVGVALQNAMSTLCDKKVFLLDPNSSCPFTIQVAAKCSWSIQLSVRSLLVLLHICFWVLDNLNLTFTSFFLLFFFISCCHCSCWQGVQTRTECKFKWR